MKYLERTTLSLMHGYSLDQFLSEPKAYKSEFESES